VCLISNYSWLDGLSFTGMRERYLEAFDRIWIDCLNGDKYKTGKLTPEGEPDPSVFSTEFNREGIQVGTAIVLLAVEAPVLRAQDRIPTGPSRTKAVRFRNLWGKAKRQQLLETAVQDGKSLYQEITPSLDLGLAFVPAQVNQSYFAWARLPDLFPVSFPGVKTSRDPLVVDIDRERLVERMEQYFDPRVSHDEMRRVCPVAMAQAARFEPETVREYLRRRGFKPENVIRYCYRPFDARWLYWEPETKLLDEKRTESFPHVFAGNIWLAAVQQNRKNFDPPIVAGCMCSLHVIERGANMFPLYLADEAPQGVLARNRGRNPRVGRASWMQAKWIRWWFRPEKMDSRKPSLEKTGGMRSGFMAPCGPRSSTLRPTESSRFLQLRTSLR
jgi:predicted helicase